MRTSMKCPSVGLLVACLSLATGLACTTGASPGSDGSTEEPPAPPPDAQPPDPTMRIFAVDPDNGPFTGGTVITIVGVGFLGDESVTVGGTMVDPLDVTVQDTNVIYAVTPPGTPGPADLVVTGSGGLATLEGGFIYDAFYVDPASGSVAGGMLVTITGQGTEFMAGTTVLFDGLDCTEVATLGAEVLTCKTPMGYAGPADVEVSGEGIADQAFTYYTGADPFNGGLGGGPIMGTLNVVVYDAASGAPLPDAFVIIGTDPLTPFQGLTNNMGQIVFSDAGLAGPLSITAAKEGYESTSLVVFDASDVSILLVPIPDPMPGPPPPGRIAGLLTGNILFGGPTGIGDAQWALVPSPRNEFEEKVAYVRTTVADLYIEELTPGAAATVYWDDTGTTGSYPYQVNSRLGTLAVYAVAGLLDNQTGNFEAFAFGVHRGLLVGPGDIITGIDIIIDTPLDEAATLQLDMPPPFGVPGPDEYRGNAVIDLGGDGLIRRFDTEIRDPTGSSIVIVPGQSGLFGNVSDGTYTIVGSAYTGDANPFSVVIHEGMTDLSTPISVGPFLGIPEMIDPPPLGIVQNWHLEFEEIGAPPGYNLMLIYKLDETPVWRIFIRGDERDFDLPDLVALGALPSQPTGELLVCVIWSVQIPGFDFDTFSYRDTNIRYWNAYSADGFYIQF